MEGETARKLELYDTQPADEYKTAWLIGNGRLGAGITGDVENEKLRVNEESIWSGGPLDRHNPDSLSQLGEVQQLIRDGRVVDAERLTMLGMAGNPTSMRYYDFLGMIHFNHYDQTGVSNYSRSLDIEKAIAEVKYKSRGINYTRQYLASHPLDIIAIRIVSDRPKAVSFCVSVERGSGENRWEEYNHKVSADATVMGGRFLGGGGHSFAAGIKVLSTGGRVRTVGQEVEVLDADEVVVLFTAWSTYRCEDPKATVLRQLEEASNSSWDAIVSQHVHDYSSLFRRVKLDLGVSSPEQFSMSLSKRVKEITSKFDPELATLQYQLGRYLLIACSRPGNLPATLQGIWAGTPDPQWGSRYTININLQMNYWLALQSNLFELNEPLLEFVQMLASSGEETAKRMYGVQGSVCHHNSNIWGDCAPQDRFAPATIWTTGLAWLCTHIWEHYLFTMDTALLHRYYPVMRKVAQFFLEFMVDYGPYKVTSPSVSPENSYIDPLSGNATACCAGPTFDSSCLRALFTSVIEGNSILGLNDDDFVAQVEANRAKLPPLRTNHYGGIREWLEDYDEAEPGHRHFSSLFGLYPGSEITSSTPTLLNAARTQLQHRLDSGGGHTAWSRVWSMALGARVLDSSFAAEGIKRLYEQLVVSPSLVAVGGKEFQLDATFGFTSAISECLLQSHETIGRHRLIRLLPALPLEWAQIGRGGSVQGLCARGGFEVDIRWNNRGELVRATIKSNRTGVYFVTASKSRYEDAIGTEIEINGDRGVFVRVGGREGRSNDVTRVE